MPSKDEKQSDYCGKNPLLMNVWGDQNNQDRDMSSIKMEIQDIKLSIDKMDKNFEIFKQEVNSRFYQMEKRLDQYEKRQDEYERKTDNKINEVIETQQFQNIALCAILKHLTIPIDPAVLERLLHPTSKIQASKQKPPIYSKEYATTPNFSSATQHQYNKDAINPRTQNITHPKPSFHQSTRFPLVKPNRTRLPNHVASFNQQRRSFISPVKESVEYRIGEPKLVGGFVTRTDQKRY